MLGAEDIVTAGQHRVAVAGGPADELDVRQFQTLRSEQFG
jgi:hypothetical protein